MAGAKQYHKKPIDIANDVVIKLKEMKRDELYLFSKAEAVMPGFINLDVSGEYLEKYLNEMNFQPDLGLDAHEGKKVVVESSIMAVRMLRSPCMSDTSVLP